MTKNISVQIPRQNRAFFNGISKDLNLFYLGDLGFFRKGKGISNNNLLETGHPCVTYGMLYTKYHGRITKIHSFVNQEISENCEQSAYGEILFPGSGETIEEIGKASVNLIDDPICVGGDTIIFKCDKRVDPMFLSYLLNSNIYFIQTRRLGQGYSVVHIYADDLKEIIIPLPPLPEQKKIAEILSTWDEAIETNETLISLYEKYLNSLALSLVKKKILINENVWKQTKLKDVFYDRKSYGCQSDNLKLHSLTIEDGVTAKTDRYNREFLVKGDSKKYKIAKLHDLVFNPQNLRYGAIAVNSIEHDVLLSPIYATLEIKDPNKYDIGYLGYLLTSKEMISFYDSIAEGTLVERMAVKPDVFLNQVFSIPDIATQKKIANILNTFKKKIDLFKKNKAELEKQKQGLMQRLLTGKVRVKLD